ncbi:MAG: hypothetical protein ACTTKL_00390 [Treponema sp.]
MSGKSFNYALRIKNSALKKALTPRAVTGTMGTGFRLPQFAARSLQRELRRLTV